MLSIMERKKSPRLFVTPIVYFLLIIAFLFFHFSQFDHFSREMKNAFYSGTVTRGRGIRQPRITKLNLDSNGLALRFSGRKPLTIITSDGIKRDLLIQELSRDKNSLQLQFKYDTNLTLTTDPVSSNSSIEISVPQTRPPVQEIQLHTEIIAPFQLNRESENQLILSDGTSSFFLNIDQDFTLDETKHILSIYMNDRTSAVLMLEDEAPGLGRSVREWLAEKSDITQRDYEAQIEEFRSLVYEGMKSRFDYTTGQFTLPDETREFSEYSYVSFISETLRRDDYSVLLQDLLSSRDRNSSSLTWYSAPFTGDIVNKGAPILRQNTADLMSRLTAFSLDGNPEVSPNREILFLQNMLNEKENNDFEAWIEENIYPLLVWLEEGLFLFHPENPVCDVKLNLLAARLIQEAGEAAENEDLIQIGRELMLTLIGRSDKNGFLPGEISFSRERPSQNSGFIRPETVLKLFPQEEFTPRFQDISEFTGRDSWLFTASESYRVKQSQNGLDIDVDFPRGQVHHLIIRGVDSFDKIILHSIIWKSDPRFQRYSDGWVYDSVNRTLYVKIRQRTNRETISIRYASEETQQEETSEGDVDNVVFSDESQAEDDQT